MDFLIPFPLINLAALSWRARPGQTSDHWVSNKYTLYAGTCFKESFLIIPIAFV